MSLSFLEQGPGGVWCDIDVVEFSYYGAPAATPKEQLYTELVDGLRGSDPCIGSGSQVINYISIVILMHSCNIVMFRILPSKGMVFLYLNITKEILNLNQDCINLLLWHCAVYDF